MDGRSHIVNLCGDSHLSPASTWGTRKLSPRLRDLGFTVRDLAVDGLDSRAALELYRQPLEGSVVISLGSNDAAPWKEVPLEEFVANYEAVIERTAPATLIVVAPPPVCEKREAGRTNCRLREYGAAARQLTARHGAVFLPLFSVLEQRMERGSDVHVADGLHLNDLAYDDLESLVVSALS